MTIHIILSIPQPDMHLTFKEFPAFQKTRFPGHSVDPLSSLKASLVPESFLLCFLRISRNFTVTFAIFIPEFSPATLCSVAAGPIPGLAGSWHLCCADGIQRSKESQGQTWACSSLPYSFSIFFLKLAMQHYTF